MSARYWCPKYGWTPLAKGDEDCGQKHLTEEEHAFREKLRYWREHGAPAYHGPRAVQ
jgi:hypothetical protein